VPRYIDIHVPGEPPQRHAFGGSLVWLSATPAGKLEPRRDGGDARAEVEFVPEPDGVRVTKLHGGRVRLVFHGAEASALTAPWGDEVFLDDCRFAFVSVTRETGANRVAFLGGALALALGTLLLLPQGAASSHAREPAVPELLEPAPESCSTQGTASADRAFEAERLARAKQQRYPFDASEGARVLALLQEASVCFREAGRVRDSQRTDAELASFQARLASDFAALRVRLSGLRAGNRPEPALAVTRELLLLTSGQLEHPYARWLSELERELERKVQKPR
jgi:hypothetical protein